MYLTEDEFKVLLGINDKLSNKGIEKKYGVKMGMNDPRIVSLAKKYGVDLYSEHLRKEISEKADLSKIKIVSKDNMPYFEYIDLELADYIDINKRDIEQLVNYFKNISNEKRTHTHRLYRTEDGLGTILYIKDLATSKISKIRANIDGDEYIGDDMIEVD